jgi:hypothetical protein
MIKSSSDVRLRLKTLAPLVALGLHKSTFCRNLGPSDASLMDDPHIQSSGWDRADFTLCERLAPRQRWPRALSDVSLSVSKKIVREPAIPEISRRHTDAVRLSRRMKLARAARDPETGTSTATIWPLV